MKINQVKALIIISIAIIILYTLGLFLPIIKNTKSSKINYFFRSELAYNLSIKNYFSLSRGNNSTKLQGL